MSLINQMLKDIDQRQGVGAAGVAGALGTTGPRVESPRVRAAALPRTLLLGAALLALGAGVYWFRSAPPVAPVSAIPAVPALSPAAPAAPAAPVAAVAAVPATPSPAQAAPSVQTVQPGPAAAPAVVAAQNPGALPLPKEPPPALPRESSRSSTATPSRTPQAEENAAGLSPVLAPLSVALRKEVAVPAPVSGQVSRVVSAEQRADNAYREAAALARQGRNALAQQNLQQALSDQPAHADARLLLARLLQDEGRTADAKALLVDGLNLNPRHVALHAALAQAQLMARDAGAAVATLERGLPAAGENADYQALLAAALQQQARHAEAVQHYVVALRQQPEAANWLVGLGVSLQALNNAAGAAEAFERALELGLPASLSQFTRERLSQLGR